MRVQMFLKQVEGCLVPGGGGKGVLTYMVYGDVPF